MKLDLAAALKANGLFSIASGIVLIAAAGPLGEVTGLPSPALRIVGLGLVPYAVLLYRWSRRRPLRRSEAWTAIAGDIGWVLGSIVLAATVTMKTAGLVAVIAVAVIVADFAVAQILGLRRLEPA